MSLDQDNEHRIKSRAVRAVREATGLHEQFAAPIVDRIFDGLYEEFGRERLYLTRSKAARDADVRRDFNGTNKTAVMRKHNISQRTLYRIIGGSG